jgi:hypothetical protein
LGLDLDCLKDPDVDDSDLDYTLISLIRIVKLVTTTSQAPVEAMSLDLDLQKDLHEAFRLLYDDEEDLDFDADWDEDKDDVQLPANNARPADVEVRSTKCSKVTIVQFIGFRAGVEG